jgi:hypothetical protein
MKKISILCLSIATLLTSCQTLTESDEERGEEIQLRESNNNIIQVPIPLSTDSIIPTILSVPPIGDDEGEGDESGGGGGGSGGSLPPSN